MRILNSLIVPKNVGGVLWAFSTSIPLQNSKQIEAGPCIVSPGIVCCAEQLF